MMFAYVFVANLFLEPYIVNYKKIHKERGFSTGSTQRSPAIFLEEYFLLSERSELKNILEGKLSACTGLFFCHFISYFCFSTFVIATSNSFSKPILFKIIFELSSTEVIISEIIKVNFLISVLPMLVLLRSHLKNLP